MCLHQAVKFVPGKDGEAGRVIMGLKETNGSLLLVVLTTSPADCLRSKQKIVISP